MKRQRRRQEGAVLLIALLMLLLLNIFTVASISSSNINMQVIQSQQRLSEVQQVAANVSIIFSATSITLLTTGPIWMAMAALTQCCLLCC